MLFSEAQKEYQIGHYLWSIAQFEVEIALSFPNLRLFNAGYARGVYQFMQRLDKKEQLMLAHGLLKERYSEAAKAVGEAVSVQEQILLNKCRVFSTNLGVKIDDEIAVRRQTGETIAFASKRKLQNTITAKFKERFEHQIVGEDHYVESEPSSIFEMRCCGWILSTHFVFGRRESFIQYYHNIESETRKPLPLRPDIMVPAMFLEERMSWLCFNELAHILKNEIDPACDTAMKLCGYFLDAAPKLLEGLEFDKVTAG